MSCELRELTGPGGEAWQQCSRCLKIYASPPPPPEWQFCIDDPPPALPESVNTPSLVERAWDLVGSLAAFMCDKCRLVSKEQYAARLAVCDTCPSRKGNWCRACGCHLSLKAKGRAFRCPEGRWSENSP